MTCFALVCSTCHLIVKKDEEALVEPPAEDAPEHETLLKQSCRGSGRPALWHLVADDA